MIITGKHLQILQIQLRYNNTKEFKMSRAGEIDILFIN